jgi:acyl-CoA synthetase (AMP-forming)/AMP-acid ligase II
MSVSSLRSDGDRSLRAIIEHQALTQPDETYLLDAQSSRGVTYKQLETLTDVWRERVARWGLAPDDRIGLLIADPIEFSLCFLSLLAAGLWVAPIDPSVNYVHGAQLNERITNMRLRYVFSDRPSPTDTRAEWRDLSTRSVANEMVANTSSTLNTFDGGVILASSGTTGTPKIMALPSAQLLHTAKLVADHNQLSPVDRGLNPLPLWHINAEVVGLLATLLAGASLALDDRFHRTGFWTQVERHHVTWINAVPAIISRLSVLHDAEVVPDRVRFIRSASAPLSPALLQQFETDMGVPIIESYGMTEAASQICVNPLDTNRKAGSVGRAIGVELRVMTMDQGAKPTVAAPNVVGKVEIRGASVIRHYDGVGYEDRFDDEGWLNTGDLGYLDDDNFVFLVGRSDDVINRGGEKIFPREIEDVILGVRGVVGAAVIGVSDDVFGQVPSSYVQLEGVSESTPVEELRIATKEIHDALVAAFSRARRPVSINVVAQLPAHATGKVQKKVLGAGSVPVLFQEHVS